MYTVTYKQVQVNACKRRSFKIRRNTKKKKTDISGTEIPLKSLKIILWTTANCLNKSKLSILKVLYLPFTQVKSWSSVSILIHVKSFCSHPIFSPHVLYHLWCPVHKSCTSEWCAVRKSCIFRVVQSISPTL